MKRPHRPLSFRAARLANDHRIGVFCIRLEASRDRMAGRFDRHLLRRARTHLGHKDGAARRLGFGAGADGLFATDTFRQFVVIEHLLFFFIVFLLSFEEGAAPCGDGGVMREHGQITYSSQWILR
jgi:hypothetical protein